MPSCPGHIICNNISLGRGFINFRAKSLKIRHFRQEFKINAVIIIMSWVVYGAAGLGIATLYVYGMRLDRRLANRMNDRFLNDGLDGPEMEGRRQRLVEILKSTDMGHSPTGRIFSPRSHRAFKRAREELERQGYDI